MVYIVLSLACLIFSISTYLILGREHKVVAGLQTESPIGLSPLEVALVYNKRVVATDAILMMYYFCGLGYIKMSEDPASGLPIFTKVKEYCGNNAVEKYLFNSIFANEPVFKPYKKNINALLKFWVAIYFLNNSDIGNLIFSNWSNRIKKIAKLLNYSMIIIINLIFLMSYQTIFMILLLSVFDLVYLYIIGSENSQEIAFGKKKRIFKGGSRIRKNVFVSILLMLATLTIKIFLRGATDENYVNNMELGKKLTEYAPLALGQLFILMSQLTSTAIDKKTRFGQKLFQEIVNYKNYLSGVENERFAMLYKTNPNIFRKDIAFGFVLGVSEKWANTFQDKNIANIYKFVYNANLLDASPKQMNEYRASLQAEIAAANKMLAEEDLKLFGVVFKGPIRELKE